MNDAASTVAKANIAQRDFWNSANAEKWRTHQATLDGLLEPMTARLFAHAALAAGERVIDVGCGTGTTTLRLARAVGAAGQVLGVDISEILLPIGQERARAEGLDQARFVRTDAQAHRFEATAYDLIFSRFGVMFFADPEAAFRNLRTALRPDGRICLGCWAPLKDNPWFRIPREIAIRHLGPPEPQAPNAPGPLAFADVDYVQSFLRAAGFGDISIAVETVALTPPIGADEIGEFACQMGPAARLIRQYEPPETTVQKMAAEITAAYREFVTDGGVRIPALINFISARTP